MNSLAKVEAQPPELPLSETAALLDVIARAATDPKVDVDKMERLMNMHERAMAKSAEQQFNVAMQAAQKNMPTVPKDGSNQSTNSRFARMETLYKRVVPIVTDHGFSVSFGTADCPLAGHFRVTARVSHTAGHSERYQVDVPSDHIGMKGSPTKTLTHGFGSAMSYGRRYLMMLIFNVNTGDDDDGQGAKAPPPPVTKLKAELWGLLRAQFKGNAQLAQDWLLREQILQPQETLGNLSAERLVEVIAETKAKL